MPNYRRAFVPGGCWFFTVNLLDRRETLLVDHIEALCAAVRQTQSRLPFHIDAMVVLPDHIHAVWSLPDGDADFAVRWSRIKYRFSLALPKGEELSDSRRRRGERGVWQRRYWEHLIRDERDFGHHIDYCWFNPVKHGHVSSVEDWPYSTFHRVMRQMEPMDFSAFEAARATYAREHHAAGYGERIDGDRAGIGAIRYAHCTLRIGMRSACGSDCNFDVGCNERSELHPPVPHAGA